MISLSAEVVDRIDRQAKAELRSRKNMVEISLNKIWGGHEASIQKVLPKEKIEALKKDCTSNTENPEREEIDFDAVKNGELPKGIKKGEMKDIINQAVKSGIYTRRQADVVLKKFT